LAYRTKDMLIVSTFLY